MGKVMSRIRPTFIVIGLALISASLDQFTKSLVRNRLELGETWVPFPALASIFDITRTSNTGVAFGMFPNAGLFVTVIAFVVIVAIIYYSFTIEHEQWPIAVALGLQLGGAIGNLTDRLLLGPVTDFFHVHNFPLFNVADASISTGVAILALLLVFEARSGTAPQPVETTAPEPDTPV